LLGIKQEESIPLESIKTFCRIVGFLTQEAFASLVRTAWMSWIVIFTMAVSLSILGGFCFAIADLTHITRTIQGNVPIIAFLKDETDASKMLTYVQGLPNIKKAELISKEAAWKTMRQDLKTRMTFEQLLNDNPLPNSIKIETLNPSYTPETAKKVSGLSGVEEVSFGHELLKKLDEISLFIKAAGTLISGVLALASLAVIMNTIRLAVLSRRRQIEIMHLVGASNAFISIPFLFEGVMFGFFASLVTTGILYGWRQFTIQKIQELFPFIPINLGIQEGLIIFTALAAVGVGLGAIGSLLSVRKHIRLAVD
jgi:cell division transport system permease protein